MFPGLRMFGISIQAIYLLHILLFSSNAFHNQANLESLIILFTFPLSISFPIWNEHLRK